MKRNFVVAAVTLVAVSSLLLSGSMSSRAIDLGDILKGGAIAFAVDRFSEPLNKAVNAITANRDLGADQATKVVPILSIGSGGYVGAAQVIGTQDQVDKVQAVAQLEGNFSGRTFRIKALVPIGSRTTSNIKRIYGVGVSAVIDVKI